MKLKHLSRFRYGDALAADAREAGDVAVYGSNGPVGVHSRANFSAPGIVIGRKGSYGKLTWASSGGFCIDTAYFVDRTCTRTHLRYLYYLLHTLKLDEGSRDSAVPGLDRQVAYDKIVPQHDPDTQKTIADLLDREIGRIDQLIEKKERFVAKATARVEALVSQAIEDDECPRIRFQNVTQRVSRPVVVGDHDELVRLGLYNRGRGIFKKPAADEEGMGVSDFFFVEQGDLIISGQFAWEGAVAMATANEDGCVVSHRYPVYRGKKSTKTAYLLGLLRSKFGDFLLNEASRGSAGRNRPLNTWRLGKEKIPVPGHELQRDVERALQFEHAIKTHTSKSVALLNEFRSALITAAVTGQIDVTAWGKKGGTDRRLDQIEEEMSA